MSHCSSSILSLWSAGQLMGSRTHTSHDDNVLYHMSLFLCIEKVLVNTANTLALQAITFFRRTKAAYISISLSLDHLATDNTILTSVLN